MANVNAQKLPASLWGGQLNLQQWEGVVLGDTPIAISLNPNLADCSVSVAGTWGGATISFQGALNSTLGDAVFVELTNPAGDALNFSADALETVLQNCFFVKPVLTGGDGTTDLDIILLVRG